MLVLAKKPKFAAEIEVKLESEPEKKSETISPNKKSKLTPNYGLELKNT